MPLPKDNRLAKKSDFDSVFKEGKAVKGSFLFVRFKDNKENLRLGLVVSKKNFPKAVTRNHIKRILSDASKTYIESHPKMTNKDIIVIVNKSAKDYVLIEELIKLLGLIA